MSDTLPEREDQMDQHQVNQSGVCEIPGCPCRGWSAEERSNTEYQRVQFPLGAVVEAITPIGRARLRDDIPVATRGKVTSHCDDGRAWVFFDGYDEGHTFHEIEKYLRVVQLPTETHEETIPCQRCEGVATTTVNTRHFGLEKLCEPCAVNVRRDGQEIASTHQPAARGGGDEWRYIETTGSAEIRIGQITLRPHWTGLADGNEIRALFKQVITEHNQHQSLVAEREQLITALQDCIQSLSKLPDVDGAYRVTVLISAGRLLAEIELNTHEQRSTSE